MTAATNPADVVALGAFLENAGICRGPLDVRRIGDGHSNLTYLVSSDGRDVVVRRPPPPPLPKGGHDVLREARIVSALEGSDVPVARVLATGEPGEAFADAPCYVMDYVDGVVVTDETPPAHASAAHRRAIAQALVDTLAALHTIDPDNVGLGDLARPDGGNARMLRRFRALIADSHGRLPGEFEPLASWLQERVPAESDTRLVHGDFRLGNVMIDPAAPRIVAVLDWELATLGDPLMDVGYLIACYAAPGESLHAVAALGSATLETGWPTRQELAERYARSTGRDLAGLSWFTVANLFKLATMYEYKRRRGDEEYYRDPALVQQFLDAANAAVA
jgi:aminoglycoside phosphotransferase (APT) family kinase protein